MDNKKNIIIWTGVILLIFILVFWGIVESKKPGEYDEVAQCITDKETTMYGAWWCPHCKAQREEFGKSFEFIDYVECAEPGRKTGGQTKECDDAGIKGYPTWVFSDGSRLEGEQSINKLAEKSGCEIN